MALEAAENPEPPSNSQSMIESTCSGKTYILEKSQESSGTSDGEPMKDSTHLEDLGEEVSKASNPLMEVSSSDQSGLVMTSSAEANPSPEEVDTSTSTTSTGGTKKTSFQEILELSQIEPLLIENGNGDSQSNEVIMTSFKELAFESPIKEVQSFLDDSLCGQQPYYQPHPEQSPDSFNATLDDTPESLEEYKMMNTSTEMTSDLSQPSTSLSKTADSFKDRSHMGKFIHFDDIGSSSEAAETPASDLIQPAVEKKMFPLFIKFDKEKPIVRPFRNLSEQEDFDDLPDGSGTFRSGSLKRKTSVTSIRSMDSVDTAGVPSPCEQKDFPPKDQDPCSKLGSDLLAMFLEQKDTDMILVTDTGDIGAHKCILSVMCPYFSSALKGDRGSKLELKGFSRDVVHFTLSFLYGGLTAIPEGVSVWEVVSMSDLLQLEDLRQVAILHIKGKFSHFFHKPCGTCVSGTLECLSYLESFGLTTLLAKSLQWQAKHFPRVWKTRAFAQLDEKHQNLCFQALLDHMTPDNAMDVLLGCEKLQATLPRSAPRGVSFEPVAALVSASLDAAVDFIAANFDSVLTSEAFLNQGRGLALNLSFLEDVLPGVVHSLSADTGCRVLVRLYELLVFLTNRMEDNSYSPNQLEVEWSERFVNLMRRLYELCDTHLIHWAAAVVKCDSWSLLTPAMQQRIKDSKMFVLLLFILFTCYTLDSVD